MEFIYGIRSDGRLLYFTIKAILQTELGPKYFECEIASTSRENWLTIANGGQIGRKLEEFNETYWPLSYVLGEVLSPVTAEYFNGMEMARSYITAKVVNSKRGKYIKKELARQESFNSTEACILNWYCTYQKKLFNGKWVSTNYIEHNCTKES